MTEKEILKKIKSCCEQVFTEFNVNIGVEENEDSDAFFRDGYFVINLFDDQLCYTPYKAEDFDMIKCKYGNYELDIDPYVVIYLKNGDRLYYYDWEVAYNQKSRWLLNCYKKFCLKDEELCEYFSK